MSGWVLNNWIEEELHYIFSRLFSIKNQFDSSNKFHKIITYLCKLNHTYIQLSFVLRNFGKIGQYFPNADINVEYIKIQINCWGMTNRNKAKTFLKNEYQF